MEQKYTFFWQDKYFNQWSSCMFMDVEGIVYNCPEQYMMAQKALLFNDRETYAKIMSSNSPRDQKAMGRLVANFNQKIWDTYSTMIVYDGNLLKFSQNTKFREKLIETKGTILVEASPYDRIWGIGLKEDDPRALNMKTWQGENRLGFVLTKVRDTIISELAHQ